MDNQDLPNNSKKQPSVETYNRVTIFKKYFSNLKIWGICFGLICLGVFIYNVYKSYIEKREEAKIAYVREKDFNIDGMNVDNFSLYSASIDSRIDGVNKRQDELFNDLSEVKSNVSNLFKSQNEVIETVKKNNKDLKEYLQKRDEQEKQDKQNLTNIFTKELDNKINNLHTSFQEEIAQAIQREKNTNQVSENVKNNDLDSIVDEDPDKIKYVSTKIRARRIDIKTSIDEPQEVDSDIQKKFIEITTSISKGILISGGLASVTGFGQAKDLPIFIQLTKKILLANDKTLDMRKCLLVGSGVGSVNSNSVDVRLVKLDCIFTDQDGKNWHAAGMVKGYLMDENGQADIKGELISKEGKILRATLPLAFIQTGLDYVSRSASSTTILGTGYGAGNLPTSLNSGLSTAGNTTLNQIATMYAQYARAMQPEVQIKAGRQVSVAFYGGEILELKPYQDQELSDGYINTSNNQENKETRSGVGLAKNRPMKNNNFDYLVPHPQYADYED